MFIPRGKAVHENLATSYVRLDALVSDLGEGGFSGVVEVLLLDSDSFVVINRGRIAAVLEKRGPGANALRYTSEHHFERPGEQPVEPDPGPAFYTRTTLAKLAERARHERGRVSIYGYSAETASALARRINASSLYIGLGGDLADLEKMILKLVREREREWFVDVNTLGVPTALVQMRNGACRILNAEDLAPDEDSEALHSLNNRALGWLLYECSQPGTTLDVYFSRGDEAIAPEVECVHGDDSIPASRSVDMLALANGAQIGSKSQGDQRQPSGSFVTNDTQSGREDWDLEPLDLIEQGSNYQEQSEGLYNSRAAGTNHQGFELRAEAGPASEIVSSTDPGWHLIEPTALESPLGTEGTETPGADALNEVKRLMGEIARAIEEAAQAVDRPESFSMALRAGQLKVADRYPFLDPFAGEIEYLTGEIVFVGQATAEEFVAGMTEALTLAVMAVMNSTAYPDRFRAYIIEDLQKLQARRRREFEGFSLDQVIEQIIHF